MLLTGSWIFSIHTMLSLLSYTIQDYQPRSGIGPLTSVINQENILFSGFWDPILHDGSPFPVLIHG